MVSFKHILLLAVVINLTLCKISIRDGLKDFQLLRDDVADFNLYRIFDMSKSKGNISFNTNVGRTFSYGQPFAYKTLDTYGVSKPNHIKAHDNWVVAVYDNTKVLFQVVDTDGKKFLDTQYVDLIKFGANLVCTSSTYNRKRAYMYIGCMDRTSTDIAPGSMYIFTYDFNSQQIVAEVSVKQDDGFRIVNSLVIFLESFPQQGSNDDQVYLLAYDQGHTIQTQTRLSNHARVFFNVESGKLEYDLIAEVTMDGQEYDIIYDMFPFQNTLILSGRIKGVGSVLTLAQCTLDLVAKTIPCNPAYKSTTISSGAVHIDQLEMTYNEIDIQENKLRYYSLNGKFTDKDWNTKLLNKMDNVKMPKFDETNIWIRGFHASQWGGVIYYGSTTRFDPGVTYLDWVTPTSMYDSQKVASVYDRDFILLGVHGTSKVMMLVRDEPMFLIEGGYYSGTNKVVVTATDDDGGISTTANLEVLDHIWDKIKIKNNIGTIEIQSSTGQLYAFDEKDIIDGNGLNVSVKTSDEKMLKGVGYTQAPVRISWKDQAQTTGDYSFTHNKVVLVNGFGSIAWGLCSDVSTNPITIVCEQVGTQALGAGNKLNTKVVSQQRITMAWSTNVSKSSSVVYFMGDDGKFSMFPFKGIVNDVDFMATDTYYYAFVLFDKARVEIWQLNKNDLQEFTPFRIIDQDYVKSEHFCPHGVSVLPNSSDDFAILSDCGRNGKAVMKMGLSHNTNHFDIPLSMRLNTIGFCSFNHEYVINTYSEVFSIAGNDTFNYFLVPLEDMDGGFAYDMFCIPTLNKVAYVAHGTKGLKNTLISQNALNGPINQGRRFPGFVTGVEATGVRAYELLGRLIYVVENEGKTTFLTTFDTPRIKFNAGKTQDEVDVTVTITVYNKGSQQTFLQLATVYPHD